MNFSDSESNKPAAPGLQMESGMTSARRRQLRPLWIMSVLVVAATVALTVPRLLAAPAVQWSQPSLLEFLLPSTSKKLTVTFRSSETLSQVDVFVAPALSSVLTISPTQLKKLAGGKEYKLDLVLKAPASTGVAFEGTVHLKMTQGTSSTKSSPLTVKVIVHNQPVPPDPGKTGTVTLAGIDSDNDGVRDDVQRHIVATHFDSARARLALFQYARAFGKVLEQANTPDAAWDSAIYASRCVLAMGPDIDGIRTMRTSLDVVTSTFLNTEPRSRAYLLAARSQRTVSDGHDNPQRFCSFDPSQLPN